VLYALAQALERQERMADVLRQGEQRYHLLFESNPSPMWVFEAATQRITDVNQAAVERYGYTRDEFLAMRLTDLHPPEDVACLDAALAGLSTAEGATHSGRHRKKDGTIIDVEATGRPLGDPMPGMRIVLANDVTDRVAAELELQATNQKLRALIDLAPQAIVAVDLDWLTTGWNRAAEQMFGWTAEEVLGRQLPYIPPDIMELFRSRQGIQTQESGIAGAETRRLRKDGTVIDVLISTAVLRDAHGAPSGFIGIINDITESKRLEAQLRQAQKMEAVGQLAGGVAHDFNNLLTSIKCNTTFLLDAMEPADPRCADVLEIDSAATRAATLTRQLLAFGRKQVLQPVVLDPNALIADLEKMLRRLVPENIRHTLQLHPETGRVMADAGQLEQVIINLVVNARDAMPHGGTLTIETTWVQLTDDPACWRHEGTLVPGEYVVISVSDTGCGMDRATQERIFEPFFTTKPTGHGTGLGLSTVYGIIKQSNGYLWVYSEPGEGSTFRIYLPRVDQPVAAAAAVREPAAQASPRGSERILIVEDDAAIRSAVSRMLARQGYTVLTAANAEDALTVLDQRDGELDLVLTDVVMPGISGPALVERLAAHAGEQGQQVRALFMSGYPRSHITRENILEPGTELLEKPFSLEQLAARVRAVLDRGVG
jgi:two-component system, cell cycle sensor histidine kinase and response regulator CckA